MSKLDAGSGHISQEDIDKMIEAIREDTVKFLFSIKSVKPGAEEQLLKREQVAKPLPTAADGSLPNTPIKKGKKIFKKLIIE